MRNYNKQTKSNRGKKWQPEFETTGYMMFTVEGTVQSVKNDEDNGCDYLQFYLDNPIVDDNINSISITVDWNLPEVFEGNRVKITGFIRSFYNSDIKRVIYGFDAKEVEVIG